MASALAMYRAFHTKQMRLYFVELDALTIGLPDAPEPSLQARIRETLGLGLRAFPRVLVPGKPARRRGTS